MSHHVAVARHATPHAALPHAPRHSVASAPAVPAPATPAIAPVSDTELLLDEPVALPRLIDAVRGATSVIDISMYSWLPSGSGAELAHVVEQKARDGVEVNVMLDGRGSIQLPGTKYAAFVAELRAAGVHVVINNSFLPAVADPVDHCKLYSIDGRVGFLGGMNLSATYDKWHDAMVTLSPANAIAAGRDFLQRWVARGGTISARNQAALYPAQMPAADPETTVLTNHPGGSEQVTAAFLQSIATAKRRVWSETPFLGSQAMVDALCGAARRGVDVRVLTDGVKTHDAVPGITLIGESYYAQLKAAGVHVYQQKQMTHSKVLLTDSTVTAGSFNLTKRSQQMHYEIDVQSTNALFVGQVDAMFGADMAVAHEVNDADLKTLGNRLLTLMHDVLHVQY